MPNSPESSLTRQTPLSPPALVPRRGWASGARPFSQLILVIWCEASAHMSDPFGFPYVFSTVFLLDRVSPSRPRSAISNDAAWAISETSMCNRDLRGYFTWVNVTKPPLGGGDSAVCLFQAEGHAFPVLFKSYCLGCSRNSSSWPSLCRAWSYRLLYRKDQEAYTGRWKGQLLWCFGRDPNFVSHPTWLGVTDWKGTSRLRM